MYGSRDIEDIVTVTDGRKSIVADVANSSADVRKFVADGFSALMQHPDFGEALFGHLSAVFGARNRVEEVKQKFVDISGLK